MKKVLSVLLAILLIISSVTSAITFTALAEDENLWTKRTSADIVKFSAPYLGLNSSNATGFSFWNPEYTYFAVKMPELENGVKYEFTCAVYTINADVRVSDFAILNQSDFEKTQSNSANNYSFPSSAKKLAPSTLYTKTPVVITPYQFIADGTQHYLGFRCGGSTNKSGTAYLYIANISLTKVPDYDIAVADGTAKVDGEVVSKTSPGKEVTITFNNAAEKVFEKWEVESGNVTLADETKSTTTFTMPNEAVSIKAVYSENLWTSVISGDVKSYSGYGSFAGYTGSKKQLNLYNMFWQSVSVKLPELKPNTTYRISMSRSFGDTIQGGTPSLSNFTMNLVSQAQHDAADGTIPEKYVVQLSNNSELNEKISVEFKTSSDTNYYLVIRVNGTYGDVCLEDLILQEVIKTDDTFDFEDVTNWERYEYGTTNIDNGPLAADKNTWHKISLNTNSKYIKEGSNSLYISPQSQINVIKLKNLKPNTDYMLQFSYITDAMKISSGTEKKTILNGCGIWNYAADGAKFGFSNTKSNGYLHVTNYSGAFFDTFFAPDGTATNDYFSRKITNQEANTWYEKTLLFNSGDVSDTLALVIVLEVNAAYFDSFDLVSLDDVKTEKADFDAPIMEGKTAEGSYNSHSSVTTLYNEVSEADYETYLTTLKSAGFAEYATNAYGDNKFAIYTKGNTTVNVTYNPYNNTALVAEQATDTLPLNVEDNVYENKDYQPLIIQIDHDGSTGGGIGLSYAVRLADGSFIVVDGGHHEKSFENADRIYNTLREYSSEENLVIAAWFITHPHDDHIGAIISFIEKYSNTVAIEEIIYNFATVEQYQSLTNSSAGKLNYHGVPAFLFSIKTMLPNTKISTCHSGYKYNIRNAVVDVMFTLEDIYPKMLGSDYSGINDNTIVFKVSFTDENVDQTLLITGDVEHVQCAEMIKKYAGNELEATFVQVIHHGISGGSYELYEKMNPEVVLWPGSSARMMKELYQSQNRYFVEEDSVKEIILSDYGTRALALPYTAPEGLTGLGKITLPADIDTINALNSYVGVSIRQAGENGTASKQALRFKFQIPEHIIRANTADGFIVAEYGMLVSESSAELNYYEGNDAYIKMSNGTKVFKGIAYNKAEDKNIVFDYVNYNNLDDGESRSTQYTCALYNIGVGSNGATDYSKYDTTYYVRSYITFKNENGEIKVYYGDVKSASVFAVMQEILKSTTTDEQTESDKAYVKNFLDGKVNGFISATAIKEAWMADETRSSLYTPAS